MNDEPGKLCRDSRAGTGEVSYITEKLRVQSPPKLMACLKEEGVNALKIRCTRAPSRSSSRRGSRTQSWWTDGRRCATSSW